MCVYYLQDCHLPAEPEHGLAVVHKKEAVDPTLSDRTRGLRFGREIRTPEGWNRPAATHFREVFVCPPPSLLVRIGAITCAMPSRLPTTPIVDELLAA